MHWPVVVDSRDEKKTVVVGVFVGLLETSSANATAHVIYLDNDGFTVYIGSDSLRPMDNGPTSVCKSVSNGNTVIVLFGKTTNPHDDGKVDDSFYKFADEILHRDESLDQKFADLRQAGPEHIKDLMALHPEWKKAPPSSIVLEVAMIGFIDESPKLWFMRPMWSIGIGGQSHQRAMPVATLSTSSSLGIPSATVLDFLVPTRAAL
jgi:hypothetical protein